MRLARFDPGSARWPLIALATLFALASVTYSVVWMYHVRVQPTAFLGIDYDYIGPVSGVRISSVGRSQYALALDDLPRLLSSVNRLFFESTAPNRYATLFFAMYSDDTRTLTCANCGHNPPLLLRGDGQVQRLAPTAFVLGLFEEWKCVIERVELQDRDTLIMFTDGITEATSDTGVEYGEERLIQIVQAQSDASASALISAIVDDVRSFSGQEQTDDLTLVVARRVG